MKRSTAIISIAFLLASLCVASVQAREGTFVIEPTREVTDSIELDISDSAVGNVSVGDGLIDFYVTSPSGLIILCYNDTAFKPFNFTAEEKGNYAMHLANSNQEGNVTVLLSYSLKLNVVVHSSITVGFSVGAAVVVASPVQTPPFDWTPWIGLFLQTAPGLLSIVKKVLDYLRNRGWKKKYKNVVVIKPLQL